MERDGDGGRWIIQDERVDYVTSGAERFLLGLRSYTGDHVRIWKRENRYVFTSSNGLELEFDENQINVLRLVLSKEIDKELPRC